MTTQRKAVTNKTRAWVFSHAWKLFRKSQMAIVSATTFADCLKRAWEKARKAAGIIAVTRQDIRNMGGIDGVLSIKALSRGRRVKAFGNTHASYHTNWGA